MPKVQRVLVVENELLILKITAQAVEALGHQAILARTGSEALTIANESEDTIHVALIDVLLPDIEGPDLADEIGRLLPRLRIIFTAGSAGSTHLASRVPTAMWMAKPVTEEELRLRLDVASRPPRRSASAKAE